VERGKQKGRTLAKGCVAHTPRGPGKHQTATREMRWGTPTEFKVEALLNGSSHPHEEGKTVQVKLEVRQGNTLPSDELKVFRLKLRPK